MKKFRVILAIGLATMTFCAMAGGVANAAAKKISRATVAPSVVVSAPVYAAPAYAAPAPYYGGVVVPSYSTFGAIR